MSDSTGSTSAYTNIPIACKLTGAELEARGEKVNSILAQAARVEELADGYAFSYASDQQLAHRLLDFVLTERQCCPFFTFELIFEENEGPVQMRLRGAEGVRDFIKAGMLDQLLA